MSVMPIFEKIRITSEYPKHGRLSEITDSDLVLNFTDRVTVVSGKNGVGKSTILDAIKHRVLEDVEPGLTIVTEIVMHFFFKLTDLNAKTMLREAPEELRYDPHYLSTWMDRSRVSHGQMNSATLNDLRALCENKEEMVIFIDEPELGLDADNLKLFIDVMVDNKNVQFIVISHHPFLLLDERFAQIELSPGYRDSVCRYLKSITTQNDVAHGIKNSEE